MFISVLSSLAIITLRTKERCVCLCLFATVQGIGLQSVILTLLGHTRFEQILQLFAISQPTTSQFPGNMLIQYMYIMTIRNNTVLMTVYNVYLTAKETHILHIWYIVKIGC